VSYITAAEYNSITGRTKAEATSGRITRACLLLDARIGNYPPDATTGWKLDMDDLTVHQERAVHEWVAFMIAFLYDNDDVAPSAASLTLGRFSVTEHGQQGNLLPERLGFVDTILISSGLIKRGVDIK
jgi:hypothetical protein